MIAHIPYAHYSNQQLSQTLEKGDADCCYFHSCTGQNNVGGPWGNYWINKSIAQRKEPTQCCDILNKAAQIGCDMLTCSKVHPSQTDADRCKQCMYCVVCSPCAPCCSIPKAHSQGQRILQGNYKLPFPQELALAPKPVEMR